MNDKITCELCNGTGYDNNKNPCLRCWRTGKVDWIDNITQPEKRISSEPWYAPAGFRRPTKITEVTIADVEHLYHPDINSIISE